MSEVQQPQLTPIEALYAISDTSLLQPFMVQAAINALDPNALTAVVDAEEVLGFAAFGSSLYPEDGDWFEVFERANRIYQHRLTRQQG